MANPYRQRALLRKVVYCVAILALFSGALLHRHLVIQPLANQLQLRETSRGEVELTSSAVRLLMTGSRGWATTILWSAAIEKQKRHEWNEVELLVGSITKLQPNFVTPWMFQSWNLAFNVSVECDRPKDKYYYVTRGIDLLAEGERRNQGRGIYPGNPEIRQTLGIFYLRKIGLSDEKNAMRCLHDLSCIDPLLRNPKWFKTADPKERREVVDKVELTRFCAANPRLVRRLREALNYTSEDEIIAFLEKNRDVPSRFEAPDWARLPAKPPAQRQSKLKEAVQQFPILPPAKDGIATRPDDYDLSSESIDVFLTARSWVEYSMEPLPPPNPDDKQIKEILKEKKQFRLPKQMATILFRGYPARCQEYIAEGLEEEGWFDEEGWLVREWFDSKPGLGDGDIRVGTEGKYHAQPAWERTAKDYETYGYNNDLLLSPATEAGLNEAAQLYRRKYKLKAGVPGDLRSDDQLELASSWLSHQRLIWSNQNRAMTNFDNHYWASLAERTHDCVMGRKRLHQADSLRKSDPEQALKAFAQAWPYWINVLLQNPKFASQPMVQEDLYEYLFKSLKLTQGQRTGPIRAAVLAAAQLGIRPLPFVDPVAALPLPLIESNLHKDQKQAVLQAIFPIRNTRGVLEWLVTPKLFEKLPDQELQKTRLFLAVWPAAPGGYPALLQPPPVWNLMLTQSKFRDGPAPAGWSYLLDEENIRAVRERFGINR